MKHFTVIASGMLAMLLCAFSAYAQQPVDLSQCFPLMLQQHRAFDSLTQLELSYIARLSEDEWNTRHTAAGGIFGIAGGTFSEFDANRKKLFSEKGLDISYFQRFSASSITLDPPAYEVMKECIKAKAATTKQGLSYVAWRDDETDVSIQFFWNPTNPPYELPARGYIENGTNLDPDVKDPRQLFANGDKIFRDGPTVELKRTDPKKRVRIVLRTNPPEVAHTPIKIEPYQPPPKYKQVWVVKTYSETPDPEKYKAGEENYDAVYDFQKPFDGNLLFVNCSFDGDYYHMSQCTPDGSSLHCRGHKQKSDNRSLWYIKVRYLSPAERCVEYCGAEPHPLPDEDDASNYSFNADQAILNRGQGCSWQAAKVR